MESTYNQSVRVLVLDTAVMERPEVIGLYDALAHDHLIANPLVRAEAVSVSMANIDEFGLIEAARRTYEKAIQ